MKLKRRDLRELSLLRLREAEILLKGRCWEGAYYLAGYAVECALKACIAKFTERFEFPDRSRVERMYTHNLTALLGVARLEKALAEAGNRQLQLAENWYTVTQWSEQARYARKAPADAKILLRAVADEKHGILRWLETHW